MPPRHARRARATRRRSATQRHQAEGHAPSDARASKQTVSVVFGEARARACSLGVLGCAVAMTLAYRGGGSVTSILLIALPTSILLAINTFFLRGADAADRSACHRFVLRNLMAQAVAMVGWILCAAAAL